MLNGEPFRAIASDAKISVAAASRHWRIHVLPTLRDAVPVHLSEFARRLVDVADDAADLRELGRLTGNHRLSLQAMRAEREALADLTNRMGVDDSEAIEQLDEARAFVLAVQRVVRDDPELAERVARELEHQGQDELADGVRSLINPRPHLRAVTKKEITR